MRVIAAGTETAGSTISSAPSQGGTPRVLQTRITLAWKFLEVVLLVVSLCLMFQSMHGDSANSDEFDHLSSGYAFLRGIDLHGRFNDPTGGFEEHPPLIKGIATLPLLFLHVELPDKPVSGPPPLTYEYFYNSKNDPDKLLFWARLPMLLLFVLLALFIRRWATELYGAAAGSFAFFLALFNTTLMASGRYVMTDFGIALFSALAIYTFLRCLKRASTPNVILAGITFGLAQVAKFSAVLLIPTFLAMAVAYWLSYPEENRKSQAISLLRVMIMIIAVGAVVILSVYTIATWNISRESQAMLIHELVGRYLPDTQAQLVEAVGSFYKPLGRYLLGLAVVAKHDMRGHPSFFLGHIAKSSGWMYFPVAFLIKTQLPLILLILLTAYMTWRKANFEGKMLILAILVYVLASLRVHINIGVRHLLPIYPLLIVWVSQAVRWPVEQAKVSLTKAVIIVGLASWYLYGALGIHPYYVSYFNELIGGPQNGFKYLSDSNVDMNQDLKSLGSYLREAGIQDAKVLCFDQMNLWNCAEVRYYLPHASLWNPNTPSSFPDMQSAGFIVAGRTPRWVSEYFFLIRDAVAMQKWQETKRRLKSLKPVHTIGYSIDIYYLKPNGTS